MEQSKQGKDVVDKKGYEKHDLPQERRVLSPTKHQTDITRRLAEADAGLVEQQFDCLEVGRHAGCFNPNAGISR